MKIASKIYTALIFVFMYAPIAVMIFFSFNSSRSTAKFDGFSLKWYEELFKNDAVAETLKNTLVLAVLSALIATVIGTAAAVGINKMKNKYVKGGITSITNIPMMNPDIVTGVAMLLLFASVGTVLGIQGRSFITVLIAHVTFNLPYVVLNVLPKIKQMDKHLPEAAMDLGCTTLQSFLKIELPCIMPGVLSGMLMAFTLSLDDFIITQFTKGEGFYTLPTYIYSMTKKTVKPDMYALSALMFVAILILLIVSNFLQTKMDSQSSKKHSK